MCLKHLLLGSLLLVLLAGSGCSRATNRLGHSSAPQPQSPVVVADTTTDSPGTNVETRVVRFSAAVRGAPPLHLQWQVDRGHGFVPVAAWATNSVLVISNAQIGDNGLYALFATNRLGVTHSTPSPLIVVEAQD